jgi:hypothetical protein
MPIIVACPGCHKSFKVADKFAGQTGPCPNCKRVLQVPTKAEEVTVHAPTEFAGGGRSTTGKLVVKPIARSNAKLQPVTAAIIAAGVLAVLVGTWALGGVFRNSMVAVAVGLLAVSPPLVIAAYAVLCDEELEPYRGKALYIRSAICAVAYTALWGAYALLASPSIGLINGELWNWVLVAPPLVLAGGMAALATLDLEFGNAIFHYGFFLLATLVLRWAAGMKWVWDVSR